eukprot:GFUD01120439.1.p1 GENE.GFUD01120439.1~~GFUD01120439.1.p1  ORF type:complete len:116 (-),score=15.60 GFUD01120439.1:9-356(-)
MARLLIVGVLCILMGIGGLVASFLVKQEQKTPWILRVAGGILILISIFFFAFYICGGKKKKKRRGSTKMKRKRNPQEISRAHIGSHKRSEAMDCHLEARKAGNCEAEVAPLKETD